jgi:hypothetical protein
MAVQVPDILILGKVKFGSLSVSQSFSSGSSVYNGTPLSFATQFEVIPQQAGYPDAINNPLYADAADILVGMKFALPTGKIYDVVYVDAYSDISSKTFYGLLKNSHRNVFATKEQAEAALALAQLSQLKKVYNDNKEIDWTDNKTDKFAIIFSKNEPLIIMLSTSNEFLSFNDFKKAEIFLENFKGLILKARALMS